MVPAYHSCQGCLLPKAVDEVPNEPYLHILIHPLPPGENKNTYSNTNNNNNNTKLNDLILT